MGEDNGFATETDPEERCDSDMEFDDSGFDWLID